MGSAAFEAPRGARDRFPEDLVLVRHLERTARRVARACRYGEVRPPLFEDTALFTRSLGEASDVVEKEMFTVPRRSGGSFSFRPEGTAGVARAYVQGGFPARAPFQKWFYVGPMFRYERPQKGRERQFTQFGVEAFGSRSPLLDAEVADLGMRFFEALGLKEGIELRVNSMGDPADRDRWREALKNHFRGQLAERCADCRSRFERNVFRLFDCKVARCQEWNAGAPPLASVMGAGARAHHERFLAGLAALGRRPREDPGLVRGLDYYTRSVFEILDPRLGARSALCGGGRYDGLVEEVGGPPTPGVGFAIGFTPLELALRERGLPPAADLADLEAEQRPDVYLVAITPEDRLEVLALAGELRAAGAGCVACDHRDRTPKAQFKEAHRLGARKVVVVGPEERESGAVLLRDMDERQERRVGRPALLGELGLASGR